MRSISQRRARPVSALWCVAACLALVACSGGAASPSPRPSHPKSPSGEPTAGPGAIAAIKTTWVTVFNGTVPISRRIPLLQDSSQFGPFIQSQAKTSVGALILQASATVSTVTLGPPGQASVIFTILFGGKPLEQNLHGMAVYDGGSWKVAAATFCSLLHLAYGTKNRLLPAACAG